MEISVKLRKKPDREDYLLYYIDPVSRREKSRTAKTSDRHEAERAAALWQAELIEHNGIDGSGWAAFRDRFDDEKLVFLAKKSRASYTTALNSFEQRTKITNIKQADASRISQFAAELAREGYPHATIKNYLTHIQAALRWAEDKSLIRKAPSVEMPRLGQRKHMKGRPLTRREVGKMLRACDALHPADAGEWRLLIRLYWFTGLRLGEAMALSWDSAPVHLRLTAKPYPMIVFDIEGQKSRQDEAVPLAPDAVAWLSKTPESRRTGYVVNVVNEAGNRYTAEKLSDELSAIGKAAGVVVEQKKGRGGQTKTKYASAHDLRRTFGTRWALRVRPLTLQKMMRHADLKTTLKYYIGLSNEDVGADLWQGRGTTPGAASVADGTR